MLVVVVVVQHHATNAKNVCPDCCLAAQVNLRTHLHACIRSPTFRAPLSLSYLLAYFSLKLNKSFDGIRLNLDCRFN